MLDLHELAKSILDRAKEGSIEAAKDGEDFMPMFFAYVGNVVRPLPMPNYTKNRELHQCIMRAAIENLNADGYLFVMEAWFAEYKDEPQPGTDDFVPPSQRTDREEMLLVHGMSRAGDQAGYCCKIKRHGHKLTFGEVENMTDTDKGKGLVAMMGPMFGEKVN
jgi:hypothetical protein